MQKALNFGEYTCPLEETLDSQDSEGKRVRRFSLMREAHTMLFAKRTPPKLNIIRRCLRELPISFCLGSVPVLAHSETAQALKAILDAVLATPFFMKYYVALFIAFALAAGVQYGWRFADERHQHWMMAVHRFLSEVGSGFLSATRTGAGAILGFLFVWQTLEPETVSLFAALKTAGAFALLIFMSAVLALGEEALKDPRAAAAQR
nr:hypothetical protein [Pseudomonas aeruginosa]